MIRHIRFFGLAVNDGSNKNFGYILVIFAVFMAFGAIFAWAWIPELQEAKRSEGWALPSKTLEELALGRMGESGGEVGFRVWRNRVRRRLWPNH